MESLVALIPYATTGLGSYCAPGTYCAAGAFAPVQCDAGLYCPWVMMDSVTDTFKCRAGFYCEGGASTPTPSGSSSGGDTCPLGHYCAEGSSTGAACPAGKFLSARGASVAEDCMECTAGSYCGNLGLAAPSGPCADGFYCGPGQAEANPIAYECPAGYKCPAGSISPAKCPPGEFTVGNRQSSCQTCPATFYCTELAAATTCAPGYFCPGGDDKISCPLGTFNSAFGAGAIADCAPCTGGYACASPATKTP